MRSQFREDMDNYLSCFYRPEVTAYEFLKCFFAFLKLSRIIEAHEDITRFLYEQKGLSENEVVLREINFKSNGVSYYSNDIDDAIFNLQIGGLIGKENPTFRKINIKYTDEEAETIIGGIDKQYADIIREIADSYIKKQNKR
jgi:hypothetical protein